MQEQNSKFISKVIIREIINDDTPFKARVSLIIGDKMAVHDIRLIIKDDGSRHVSFCARKVDGAYRDIVHPMNKTARKEFNDVCFEKYDKIIKSNEKYSQPGRHKLGSSEFRN